MKVARIAYANTEPFFHFWNEQAFELFPGVPRKLAEAADHNDVIAGPLPLVECWRLEDRFEPLGTWGIAAGERCRSVYVLSQQPFSELNHVTIGVTKESATSVLLCETLLRQKYGNDVTLRPGLEIQDSAWLVIGDQALSLAHRSARKAWAHVTDLASEWWNWQKKPFVFARWVVKKDLPQAMKQRLEQELTRSYEQGMAQLDHVSYQTAKRLGLQSEFVESYLRDFMYRLDQPALESAESFKKITEELRYAASVAH